MDFPSPSTQKLLLKSFFPSLSIHSFLTIHIFKLSYRLGIPLCSAYANVCMRDVFKLLAVWWERQTDKKYMQIMVSLQKAAGKRLRWSPTLNTLTKPRWARTCINRNLKAEDDTALQEDMGWVDESIQAGK